MKPLEESQVSNWAEYLSFEESEAVTTETLLMTPPSSDAQDAEPTVVITQADAVLAKKRVRILYERCLVACALYEHLWIRYAKYLEVSSMQPRCRFYAWL